jgi:DNA-binding HxlR family transcriptional regulator
MTNSNVISTALESIRARLTEVEAQTAVLHGEQKRLQAAAESLARLVEGEGIDAHGRTCSGDTQFSSGVAIDRTRRRQGGTVKSEILAALQDAADEGMRRDELGERLTDVSDATISATLSALKREGRVRTRPTGPGRKLTWYYQVNEPKSGDETTPVRVTTGRHGVSLPAVSFVNGRAHPEG